MVQINIDSKYLIRWGIPGWVFLVLIIVGEYQLRNIDLGGTKEYSLIISLLVSSLALGVPIGYIFHQISFFGWVLAYREKEKRDEYFVEEMEWHKNLLSRQEQENRYLEERYRYLLGKVHEYGALKLSTIVALLWNLIRGFSTLSETSIMYWLLTVVISILVVITCCNRKYAEKNFRYFKKYFEADKSG